MALLLVMMGVNAFWNYVFFRTQNLLLSFFAFAFYPFVAIALFICLLQFDKIAAWSLVLLCIFALCCAVGIWIVEAQSEFKMSHRPTPPNKRMHPSPQSEFLMLR